MTITKKQIIELENLRSLLNEYIANLKDGECFTEKILEISQKLDVLIVEYMESSDKK